MNNERTGRHLILHGGMPKTGSGSIQRALITQAWRDLLVSARVCFLQPPRPGACGNHSQYFWALLAQPSWRTPAEHAVTVDAMALNIRQTLPRVPEGVQVLLSAESVGEVAARSRESLERIRDYLLGFFSEITLLFYVREPLSYACSRIQHDVKAGYPLKRALQGALASSDGGALIRNAREVFGAERVTIRSFDRMLMLSSDVVLDFASGVLGVSPSAGRNLVPQAVALNLALTIEMLEILMQMYAEERVTPQNVKGRFLGLAGGVRWGGTSFGPAFFSTEDRARLLEVTDVVRADIEGLLGYNPFPSYRPFVGSTWEPIATDPQVHERNCILLRTVIADLKRRGRSSDGALDSLRPTVGLGAPGGGARRSEVLDLLRMVYDLC